MDSSPSFPTYRSQNGGRHAHQTYDQYDYAEPSSDPPSDGSQQSDDPAVLVDLLANNYNLSLDLRSDLHSFLDIVHSLPPMQLRMALIQQATTLSNQQLLIETKALCSTIHEVATKIYKSLSDNAQITKHQMSEITAACKVLFYTGRRFNFSNEDFKADVIPYLEKHADTNGLAIIFADKTRAHHKLLVAKVGLAASNTKTWLRRIVVGSLSDNEKQTPGMSVTALATYLYKKCLGGGTSENVKPQHAIWCAILRSILRNNADLRFVISTDNTCNDDDEEVEFPTVPSTVPAKRSRTGAVIAQNTDGKRIEHFWRQITVIWTALNKKHGSTDLQCEGWTNYINCCVAEELTLFPNDRLALIVGNKNAVAASATPAPASFGRLSGALREGGTSSRQPLTSTSAGNASLPTLPGVFVGRPPLGALDQMMLTPTPFTFGNSAVSSGLTLPPLNSLGGGSSRR
ncbi:hypothetical protein DFH08DRAFT_949532 [Mycena albidolilacea]|uniref:Uncharacterized protein n=1 Tax=Mycena albidolilacea TaxID=1033008 RepID=A0AAD7AN14_9AGAR|nr:hypothetical protein DFH08DRAFT_949532 [Mycena albidolilacea]